MLWKAEREYPNFRVINPTKQPLSGTIYFWFESDEELEVQVVR